MTTTRNLSKEMAKHCNNVVPHKLPTDLILAQNITKDSTGNSQKIHDDVEIKEKESTSYQIDYQKIKKLGHGGFANVYLGKWNGQDVAIKEMKFTIKRLGEYQQEKNIMQKLTELNAPHVVQFYSYNYKINHYSIVMEYMPKKSLCEFIDDTEEQPLDWSLRYGIMKNITQAVSFLHQHKIVHRDIKTENVLLDENLQAKLCDFGFAKYIDDKIECTGTPKCIAPELLLKIAPHTEKSDIYSLAITFLEIAAWTYHGDFPYDCYSREDIFTAVTAGKRETIPLMAPPGLARLIGRGWLQDPKDRPTAEEVLTELCLQVKTS